VLPQHHEETIVTPRFIFHTTPLAGVLLVERKPINDGRGFFSRLYCLQEFAAIGLDKPLAQINHSCSRLKGTVRGLHFQYPPHAETKVISCIAGRIFDVAVDLRAGSPTFLQWFGFELSAENQESMVIPSGCAHGFQSLTDETEIIYLVTTPYSPQAEDGVNPFDPAVGIIWPETVSEVSPRDRERGMLNPATFHGIN